MNKNLNGFGTWWWRLMGAQSSPQCRINEPTGSRRSFGGVVEPLPTMLCVVSGKSAVVKIKQVPAAMAKSQKMQIQLLAYVKQPPRMGPMLSAMVMLPESASGLRRHELYKWTLTQKRQRL
ncbi:hypothetical protein RRF57_003087 [Xylaria bambusicola]|uniref:Uncharacterized protein n=1 Tax=Xylaria bambusicola TaxID=326684 RepID=A0AAN7UG39_9PEZI